MYIYFQKLFCQRSYDAKALLKQYAAESSNQGRNELAQKGTYLFVACNAFVCTHQRWQISNTTECYSMWKG